VDDFIGACRTRMKGQRMRPEPSEASAENLSSL
jgi:hypothetical protein